MKEKIKIQCEYEDKLHKMTEECKGKLQERREAAQRDLEKQACGNVSVEKEFRQIERLQDEERLVLLQEHRLEMERFVQEYEHRLAELANKIEGVRTDLVGQQDAYDGKLETIITNTALKERIILENSQLERQKQVAREQINQLKGELAGRSERVAEQTDELLRLKSKNDELQKWRTVMDFQLGDLKKQVEPKAHDIEVRRTEIVQNEAFLRQMKVSNAKDTAELEQMETDINTLYNQILKASQDGQACQAKINHFKNHVQRVFAEVEPDTWAAEVAKLYSMFVTRHLTEEEDQALRDTLDEFERHKSALARKIVKLRVKTEVDTESSGTSFLKQINKNEELMIELGRLRTENKGLKADLHLAQTELNSLLRRCERESKQLVTKVKTMFRSASLAQPVQPTVQRKVTRGGLSMMVEQFHG
jgi:chromosome segregation ATPase